MEAKDKDEIKLLILLIVIVTATILIMFVAFNIGNLGMFFGNNILTNNAKTSYNYTSNVTKIDSNKELSDSKQISDVLLEQNKMIYVGGTLILTSKVTNNGLVKDNLRFKIRLIANDNRIVAEVMGYVGKIKTNETKYIDSYISRNISNLKDITYEVIE